MAEFKSRKLKPFDKTSQHKIKVPLPASGTDECEGDELVPEGIILRYGLRSYQGLEVVVIGQVADLTGVGSHLCRLCPARLVPRQMLFAGHKPNLGVKRFGQLQV